MVAIHGVESRHQLARSTSLQHRTSHLTNSEYKLYRHLFGWPQQRLRKSHERECHQGSCQPNGHHELELARPATLAVAMPQHQNQQIEFESQTKSQPSTRQGQVKVHSARWTKNDYYERQPQCGGAQVSSVQDISRCQVVTLVYLEHQYPLPPSLDLLDKLQQLCGWLPLLTTSDTVENKFAILP